MRLTKYEKWISNWTIFVILLFAVLKYHFKIEDTIDSRYIGIMVLAVSFIYLSINFFESIEDILVYRYKIIEEKSFSRRYKAEVLLIGWCFIPYWKPVEEESHSIKYQNIFGAKEKSYYSTETTFNTEEEARKAIMRHKAKIKNNRKDFFKRPLKEDIKVTYL